MARPQVEIDLSELERLASLGMSQREISHRLHISESTFYELKKSNSEFLEKIRAGRASITEQCSQIVIDAAIKTRDPKWALEVLRRHGDRWKDKPETDGCGSLVNLEDLVD